MDNTETITFNSADWSGDNETATVTRVDNYKSLVTFRGGQFEAISYVEKHEGETLFEGYVLRQDGRKQVSAIQCGKTWVAEEYGIEREDRNPIVALLQVAANIL